MSQISSLTATLKGRPVSATKNKKVAVTLYAIAPGHRPSEGAALFAHTQAALTVLGMWAPQRPAAPADKLEALIGERAFRHHLKQRNFEGSDKIRLSSDGYAAFRKRETAGKIDPNLVEAFVASLRTGAAAPGVPAAHIHAIPA